MKAKKYISLLLTLLLVIGLTVLPVSAGSCETCVDDDNNNFCDICKECIYECLDQRYDGDHNCDDCGKENVSYCQDDDSDGEHNCDDCGKENVSYCQDDHYDGDHTCDECGKEGASKCWVDIIVDDDHICDDCGKERVTPCYDRYDPYSSVKDYYEDHICELCGAAMPCYDGDKDHHCDGCDMTQPGCGILTGDYCSTCGAVKINENTFPDKTFRDTIISEHSSASDGIFTPKELKSFTWLNVSNKKTITSLKGIEYLTNLDRVTAGYNQITSVDFSKNAVLKELYIYSNLLTSIDLSGNPMLTELGISKNHLSSLDVSKNPMLSYLDCSQNYLTSLDVSNNRELTELQCYDNQITSLDLSKHTKMATLECYNNLITTLTIAESPNWSKLSCGNNRIETLDVSKAPTLTELLCYRNNLSTLDLSANTKLEFLNCSNNKLTTLDLSNPTPLKTVLVRDCDLISLNVRGLTYLSTLECYGNKLTSLDVSNNTYLSRLHCYSNNLTSMDFSKNTALKDLNICHNDLTILDVSKNILLETLQFTGNQITSMDLSDNSKLISISSNCYYPIELDSNKQFDLTTLPGNFNPMNASNWSLFGWEGAVSVSGNTVTVNPSFTQPYGEISYSYNAGNNKTCYFTLAFGRRTERISGANRYETAVHVANQMKHELGVNKFDAIVLANGYNFADALSGSYLAAMKDAPILLTWIGKDKYNYLNEYTVSYVKENLAEGGTVYILGGTSAVPQMVDDLLEGYNVKRLAGENRFETNLLILKEAGVKAGDEVLVCTAGGFADSLSASATGKPILLVHKKLNDSQKAYLGTLQNCSYTMIGGTSAVSDAVMAEFNAYGATSRLAGGNRFETSVEVAEKYFYHTDGGVVLAYAKDFPDGLCGGPLAYAKGHPLILTMTKGEAKAAEYVKANDIREGLILGGEKLISNDTVLDMFYN